MQSIPILVYHSVGRDCAPAYRRWMVTERELDAHLRALSQRGYRSITVADLALLRSRGQLVPPRTCLITFDDGLRDFSEAALPVLAARKFAATLYVATGFVGKTARWLSDLGEGNRPMLDWGALRDLQRAGVEIGAHSVSHPELDTLSRAKATRELRDSKRPWKTVWVLPSPHLPTPRLRVKRNTPHCARGRIPCGLPRSPCAE